MLTGGILVMQKHHSLVAAFRSGETELQCYFRQEGVDFRLTVNAVFILVIGKGLAEVGDRGGIVGQGRDCSGLGKRFFLGDGIEQTGHIDFVFSSLDAREVIVVPARRSYDLSPVISASG